MASVTPIRSKLTLGGSEIPALLGLDDYLTPYALGCRKLGLTEPPEQSQAMRNGQRLQNVHAELVEEAGYQLLPAPADGFKHPDLSWLHVHPDGLLALDGQRAPLELKLHGTRPSERQWKRDYIQAFVYVHTLGSSSGLLSVLHGGYGGFQREEEIVTEDAELWGFVVDACERFLATLKRGNLPKPSGSTADREAIRERFSQANAGEAIRLSREGWEHVRSIRKLDELIASAKEQRERHAQAVQDEMGEATEAISPFDTPAARWRPVESNRLDTKALREARPELADMFSKTTTTRRFEVNP